MKAIIRRLRRLEEEKEERVVREQEEGPSPVELIRERRRRRAEASGEPIEERPCEWHVDDQNGSLSVADILRAGRMRAAALNARQGSLPVNQQRRSFPDRTARGSHLARSMTNLLKRK